LYAPGGFDYRKNIANLLKAFALFKSEASERFQLVITGIMSDTENKICQEYLTAVNLTNEDIIFTNYISDDELIALYRSTFLYIFPSLMEGCGLSVIEAMASGAPVIGSNCTSVPEVIGNSDYTFDPNDPVSIKNKINLATNDPSFYKKLKIHSASNYKKFSWQNVASNIYDALKRHVKTLKYNEKSDFRSLLEEVAIKYHPHSIQSKELDMLHEVFAINFNE
jgi:glycosyltransferase involved in cell wall biosynthesis